ncbi:MAG: membrane dipeptidase [Bacteroidota bacterium]
MSLAKPIIDIHCHPSIKTWLFNSNFEDDHWSFSRDFFPTDMRCDYPKMKEGKVDLIMSAHYLTENNLITDCKNIKGLSKVLFFLWKNLKKKIESKSSPTKAFEQTMEIIKHFEKKINKAKKKGCKIEIARSKKSMQNNLSKGNKVILHTIEGAHSLGRKIKGVSPNYIDHIDQFFKKGVCMITLGHFYKNDIVAPVESIPHAMKKKLGCTIKKNLSLGLTKVGEDVVKHMLDIGMIIDLTHATPVARKKIYRINESRGDKKRPLVFSHVGVYKHFNHPMAPTDEEILKIQDCGGVIGVIFYNYWLIGKEEGDPVPTFIDFKKEYGMQHVIKTIDHIGKVTGTFENISIGSDLDGFTDPPDDLYNLAKMDSLRKRLVKKYGVAVSRKILGGNALRVLMNGWGR